MRRGEGVEVVACHDDWSVWFAARAVGAGGGAPPRDGPAAMCMPRLLYGGHKLRELAGAGAGAGVGELGGAEAGAGVGVEPGAGLAPYRMALRAAVGAGARRALAVGDGHWVAALAAEAGAAEVVDVEAGDAAAALAAACFEANALDNARVAVQPPPLHHPPALLPPPPPPSLFFSSFSLCFLLLIRPLSSSSSSSSLTPPQRAGPGGWEDFAEECARAAAGGGGGGGSALASAGGAGGFDLVVAEPFFLGAAAGAFAGGGGTQAPPTLHPERERQNVKMTNVKCILQSAFDAAAGPPRPPPDCDAAPARCSVRQPGILGRARRARTAARPGRAHAPDRRGHPRPGRFVRTPPPEPVRPAPLARPEWPRTPPLPAHVPRARGRR